MKKRRPGALRGVGILEFAVFLNYNFFILLFIGRFEFIRFVVLDRADAKQAAQQDAYDRGGLRDLVGIWPSPYRTQAHVCGRECRDSDQG